MKKLLSLVLAMLLVLSMVACGAQEEVAAPAATEAAPAATEKAEEAVPVEQEEKKSLRIAYSCTGPGIFQDMIINSVDEWCKANGHEFVYTFNGGNAQQTLADCQTYLNAEYDYLMVYVLDEGTQESVRALAEGKHTKVVFMGLEVPGYTFISGGNYEGAVVCGEKAWEAVQEQWGGEVDLFVILQATSYGVINTERTSGMIDGFCEAAGFNEEDIVWLDYDDVLKCQEVFATTLVAHPDAEKILVYGSTDVNHTAGAWNAAVAAGREDQLIITGAHVADERTPGWLVNYPDNWIGQSDPMGLGFGLGYIEFIERSEAGEDLTGTMIPGSQVWVDDTNVADYYEVK